MKKFDVPEMEVFMLSTEKVTGPSVEQGDERKED